MSNYLTWTYEKFIELQGWLWHSHMKAQYYNDGKSEQSKECLELGACVHIAFFSDRKVLAGHWGVLQPSASSEEHCTLVLFLW